MEPPAKPSLQPPAIPASPKPATSPTTSKPDAATTETASQAPLKKKSRLNWKILLIIIGGILFIMALIVTNLSPRTKVSGPKPQSIVPTPTTAPRPTVPQFPLGEPSVYVNDPQILQLEGALKTFERQLDSIDYREQDLDPPTLDMKVEFKLIPTPKPR